MPNNIDSLMNDRVTVPVYVHIISQSMNEKVIDLSVVKRVIFECR